MTIDTLQKKVWIPAISDERLKGLADRIKPVHRFKKGLRYLIPSHSLRGTPYLRNPEPAGYAESLATLADTATYHRFRAHVEFVPSIAEVIAQIPEEYVGSTIAFEIVKMPGSSSQSDVENEALNAGYHMATTRLYKAA